MAEHQLPADTGLRCPACDYSLTALTSNVCPECGESFLIADSAGLPRQEPPSRFSRYTTQLYYAGTAVIVLGWFDVVSPTISWIAFGVLMAIWILPQPRRS